MKQKRTCEDCGVEFNVKHIIWFKKKLLCGHCRRKLQTSRIQESATCLAMEKIK